MSGMIILALGLCLWVAAHLFKRIAPAQRATLTRAMGEGSKGVFAALIVASIVVMVIGYQRAEYVWLWFPQSWFGHLNNLLMLVALYVYGIGMARGELSTKIRHPQLWATVIWAGAHLLVNGHLAALILFGGIGLWALASIALINAQDGGWVPKPAKGSWGRDGAAVGIVLVAFVVVGGIHTWLGVNPFGSL
jgi:uncharacterized membrane protein